MFVRWKRRERVCTRKRPRWGQKAGPTGKFLLTAVLVRSERRDGKPRQKIVAHLGSIGDDKIKYANLRKAFWDAVDGKLSMLEPADRQKAEATIAAVVPRPTDEQLEADARELAEIFQRISGAK